MSSPSDEELLQAITELQPLHPQLGRVKFLSLLRSNHSWVLSKQRLKKCMDENDLNPTSENDNEDSQLPRNDDFQIIVKEAFNDFKSRERNFFLQALSNSQHLKLSDTRTSNPINAACHPDDFIYDNLSKMVQECLQPVFEQHKLSKYGFLLKQITHPLATSKQHYFKTAWVFADTRSPLWAEVNDVFFNPHAKPIDDDRVGVALGYPEVSRSFAGESKFSAVDLTEMGELEVEMGRRVCSVRAFDFRCGSEHFGNLVPYFERCAAAAKEVGTVLRM